MDVMAWGAIGQIVIAVGIVLEIAVIPAIYLIYKLWHRVESNREEISSLTNNYEKDIKNTKELYDEKLKNIQEDVNKIIEDFDEHANKDGHIIKERLTRLETNQAIIIKKLDKLNGNHK